MIAIRPAAERGHADYGWLDTRYSFSFADYHDPEHMAWGALRVINDDTVAPGRGFDTHGHRDMEIITVVLEGALQHRDSLGNGTVIRPGEIQRMSAGSGVRHSEFNPDPAQPARLLQIWIEPAARGLPPSYEQRAIAFGVDAWQPLASPDGVGGSVRIHQDATLSGARLAAGGILAYPLTAGRLAYVHVIAGRIELAGQSLAPGDGARLRDLPVISIVAQESAEILLFDLPPA